jgi:chromosome segregation ATPase
VPPALILEQRAGPVRTRPGKTGVGKTGKARSLPPPDGSPAVQRHYDRAVATLFIETPTVTSGEIEATARIPQAAADDPDLSGMITSVAQDDLEQRVAALEHEQARLREHLRVAEGDAGAARALAAGADRDTSEVRTELRAHLQALNALRETQVEQGHKLDTLERKVDEGFARADERFAQVAEGFARADERFDKLSIGLAEITALLKRLEPDPGVE